MPRSLIPYIPLANTKTVRPMKPITLARNLYRSKTPITFANSMTNSLDDRCRSQSFTEPYIADSHCWRHSISYIRVRLRLRVERLATNSRSRSTCYFTHEARYFILLYLFTRTSEYKHIAYIFRDNPCGMGKGLILVQLVGFKSI